MYNNQLYKFTANHSAGDWTGNDVVAIQTSTMVSDYVSRNAYEVVTGIDIDDAGIQITGAKYVNISSGGTFNVDATNFKIDSTNKYVKTGDWKLEPRGLVGEYYVSTSQTNCRVIYGRSGYVFQNDVPQMYVFSNVMSAMNSKYGGSFSFGLRQPGSTVDDIWFYINTYPGLGGGPVLDIGASYLSNGGSTDVSSRLGSSINKWDVYGKVIRYFSLIQDSSKDVKHNIQNMPSVGEKLDELKPVTFIYDDDAEEKVRTGLIYEDTIEVMPEICTQDESNKAISYVELIPALLKEIQDLRSRVAELERR